MVVWRVWLGLVLVYWVFLIFLFLLATVTHSFSVDPSFVFFYSVAVITGG